MSDHFIKIKMLSKLPYLKLYFTSKITKSIASFCGINSIDAKSALDGIYSVPYTVKKDELDIFISRMGFRSNTNLPNISGHMKHEV